MPQGAPSARLVPYCLRRAIEYLNFLSDIVSKWALGAPKETPRWEMGPGLGLRSREQLDAELR
jgi:hypothetical protein